MIKELLSQKELFIFDLDGTATDTEPCHYEAYRRTMEKLCPGNTIPPEEFLSCYVGHSETEIYSLLKKNKSVDFDDDIFFATRIDNLFKIVLEKKLTTALFFRELCILFPHKRFIALTSQRTFVLERFQRIIDYLKIEEFISVADKPFSKPDVLADTSSYLGTTQEKCVIFEDFAPTLRAAKANGVLAIGVQHDFNRLSLDDCDHIIDIHKSIM